MNAPADYSSLADLRLLAEFPGLNVKSAKMLEVNTLFALYLIEAESQ